MTFAQSASCKNLDLRSVNLRFLQSHLVQNSSTSAAPHLCGITLKNEFKPNLKKCWCIPPEKSAAFVAAMEDVLSVYSRPYDEKRPVVLAPLVVQASISLGIVNLPLNEMHITYVIISQLCLFFNELWRISSGTEKNLCRSCWRTTCSEFRTRN